VDRLLGEHGVLKDSRAGRWIAERLSMGTVCSAANGGRALKNRENE
jgi:hypothetical protein